MTRTQLDILEQAIPEFIINLKKYGTTSKALEALKRTFKSNNITIQDWNLVLEVVGQQSDIFNALSDVTSLEETLVTVLEKITNALEETQTDLATLDSNKADKSEIDSKVDKLTTNGNHVYAHEGITQTEYAVDTGSSPNVIVKRTSTGSIMVPQTPAYSYEATSKDYVDSENATIYNNLQSKEDITNKVSTFQSTPDNTHYPTEKLVYDNLQDIREVAEGKNSAYVLDYTYGVLVANLVQNPGSFKFYDVDGNLHEGSDLADFIDGYLEGNSAFNSQADSIALNLHGQIPAADRYFYVFSNFGGHFVTDYPVIVRDYELEKILKRNGDVIFVIQTGVPDRWVAITGNGSFYAYKLETALSNYATKEYVHEEMCKKVTWSELKNLRDNSQLIPGQSYRITDYVCTTTYPATSAASHQFDIIVRAIDVNKLDENARAAVHNGDTYFNPASGYKPKLSAWELKYCLDNDTNRFGWADSTNGKGVIYWMKDEFNNECPYDFKNILFTHGSSYLNAYTFSYTENSTIKDASLLTSKKCCGNVMKEFYYLNKIQLNFNVFYSTSTIFDCSHNTFGNDCRFNTFGNNCYNNTFGNDCYNNTFGSGCYNNTFGNDCYNNTFGSGCYHNIFGNYYYYNTFGNNCYHNIFGNECNSNTFDNMCHHNAFGNYCYYNTFGTECPYNTFGNHCYSNTFGKNCYSNTFDNECYHNIFGIYCSYNTFGDDCFYNTFGTSSSAINFCKHIIFDNGCSYIYLFSDDIAASRSNRLQNVHIHLGVVGSSDQNRLSIVVPDRALPYSIDYYKNNSQEVYL